MFSEFDKRMKSYERDYRLIDFLPFIARIDGKCFHTFCSDLKRPYEEKLSELMIECTKKLVREFNFNVGYTQSDEISLCYYNDQINTQLPFSGRILKLCSVLSSFTAAVFNKYLFEFLPSKKYDIAYFDCRVLTYLI